MESPVAAHAEAVFEVGPDGDCLQEVASRDWVHLRGGIAELAEFIGERR
jgi:hypothetical protein